MCLKLCPLLILIAAIDIGYGKVTLSSIGNVTIFFSGYNPVYNCGSPSGTITSVQWFINGTLLEDLNLTNVMTEFGEVSRQGAIVFRDISVEPHNNTIIQCRAILNGETVDSNNSTLLVQGLLPAVGSLTATPIQLDSIISLTWTPPFTLDIPNVDPDITYCVGVANSTSSSVIYSECGITDTQYNYTVSPPNDIVCDTYTFIITPVNVVGNGTSASVTRGILSSESVIQNFEEASIEPVQNGSNLLFTFNVSAPVCSGSVSLQDIYDSSYILGPIEVTPDNQDNSSISFMIPRSRVNLNQFYDATFTLINSAGSTISNNNKISTYDVQDTTYNIGDGSVIVTIDYTENTEALGALLALMYLDQDGNIVCNQSIYAAIRRSEDDFTLTMGDPAITTYMGLAYDIDRRNGPGLEKNTNPAVRRQVDIGNKMPVSSDSASNCIVTYVSGTASVSCANSTSSGYQVILLQKNGSNILTAVNVSSGTPVTLPIPSGRYCILELPMEDNELIYSEVRYSSEFIAVEEEDSSTQSSTIAIVEIVNGVDAIGVAIGIVIFLICTMLVISIIVVCVATFKIKKKRKLYIVDGESNYYEAATQHLEHRPPTYASVVPVASRQVSAVTVSTDHSRELLLDTEAPPPIPSQNFSDEPLEAPPPIPHQDLSDESLLPPMPPQDLSDEPLLPPTPENNGVYDVVKDNGTMKLAMGLYKTKNTDLMYSEIHTRSGAGMSAPDVFGVKYEVVTGSKNKLGQNYSFVFPCQTQPLFTHDRDETTVIYSGLKKKEEINKEMKEGPTQEVKEGLVTGNGEEEKEGATGGGEEEKEERATGSGEEEDEGVATGSGEGVKKGLAIGSDEEEDEGIATESGEEEDEGLATGSDEEEDKGIATESDEEEKKKLATWSVVTGGVPAYTDVQEVTPDIEPVRHTNFATARFSTLQSGAVRSFKVCAGGDDDESNDYYAHECTEPSDRKSYAMLKTIIVPKRPYFFMCPALEEAKDQTVRDDLASCSNKLKYIGGRLRMGPYIEECLRMGPGIDQQLLSTISTSDVMLHVILEWLNGGERDSWSFVRILQDDGIKKVKMRLHHGNHSYKLVL